MRCLICEKTYVKDKKKGMHKLLLLQNKRKVNIVYICNNCFKGEYKDKKRIEAMMNRNEAMMNRNKFLNDEIKKLEKIIEVLKTNSELYKNMINKKPYLSQNYHMVLEHIDNVEQKYLINK